MITNQNARRNLNPSQLAMQGANLAALYSEKAKERQGTRTDLNQEFEESERGSSNKKAADKMGVSHSSIASAIKVIENGNPKLIKLVESGKISVSIAAKVADEPPEVQESIVEEAIIEILEGKKPNIRAILREMKSETADTPEIVPEMADVQEIASETVDLQMKDGSVSDSTIEEKEKPSDNQGRSEGTKITNRLMDLLEELESNEEEETACGSCCNPWDGPWVCEKCNGWWHSLRMNSMPEYCPICGKAPIRRATCMD
jgi:rubrerythrin